MTTFHFDLSQWLLPAVFLLASAWFGWGLNRARRSDLVQDSGFVVDRNFEPGSARALIGLKAIWLGLSVAGLIASTWSALD